MLFQGVDYFDCSIGAIISVVSIVRILLIDLLFWFSPIAFGKTDFSAYNTRHRRVFNMPRFRTDRFKFSFIPAMCACANLDF